MFYTCSLSIPANTGFDAPEELRVDLTHGVITHVEVEFPAGCAGLVHTYAKHGLHQAWPTNPEGRFRSNGSTIAWAEYYEFFRDPYQLVLCGYNEDDTYPHTVAWRIELTDQEVAERGKSVGTFMDKVRLLLGLK